MVSESEKFLVVKGKAGLGNRMLAALSGILFAKLTRRRLVIDWGDETYSDDGSNVFPRLFECPDVDLATAVPDTESISPSLWRGRMAQSVAEVIQEIDPSAHTSRSGYRRFSADLTRLDHPETILVMFSYTHTIPVLRRHFREEFSYLRKMSDEEILSRLLRTNLVLHHAIRARVASWKTAHFGQAPVIGTHIRFMDTRFPLLPMLDRRTSIESIFGAIDRIRRKVSDQTIFVATDNREAQRQVEERYLRTISTEKWFPTTGIDLHQNRECPDKLQNAVEALMDMYLLAECDYLVFPGSSTFSYMSSLYTSMPRANIVDIERNDPIIRAIKLARQWRSRVG
jgi:hypothetical protein